APRADRGEGGQRRLPPPPHVPRLWAEYRQRPPALGDLPLHPGRHDIPPDEYRPELLALPQARHARARRLLLPGRLLEPDKAGRTLAHRVRGATVAAPRDPGPVRPQDEHSGIALGDELQERVDRVRAAHAKPLDGYGQRLSELSRLAQLLLEVLPLDVAVAQKRPRRRRDLGDVDDEERLPDLDGRVDREGDRVLGKRDVERREQHGPAGSGMQRDVRPRVLPPDGQHGYSG